MDTHRLLAVEERVRYATYLPQHHMCDRPGIGVLLQSPDVQSNGLLDDVVLAVGDEERPVGEVHDGRHDHYAREEGRVVQQLPR